LAAQRLIEMPPDETPVWLVLSGAYVEQELSAEFGRLPPAFLPVGTQRLYELQFSRLPPGRAWLTLPEDFLIPPSDAARLAALGVTVITSPAGYSLGQAVMWALSYIGVGQHPVHILHGDTLVEDVAFDVIDAVAIADPADGYAWAEVRTEDGHVVSMETVRGVDAARPCPVACGYFACGNALALVRCIARAGGDFVGGFSGYCGEHDVVALPVSRWYDFGHVQTFFRSRRAVATARAFNTLRIDARVVRKSSADADKIRAEAEWLLAAPAVLRPYCARLIDHGTDSNGDAWYETEYEYLPSLAELFVYGANARATWVAVMASCEEFLRTCAALHDPDARAESGDGALAALTVVKTQTRLERFAAETGFDIDGPTWFDGRPLPSLRAIGAALPGFIDLASGRAACVMHGDFCFSNILYNARTRRIRVIDPRGSAVPGQPGLFGDSRYDLGKLAHSAIGRYDQIVAGRCSVGQDGMRFTLSFEDAPHHAWLADLLSDMTVDGIAAVGTEVRAVMAGLFLSMLPLHAERADRQLAFVANALRLFAELDGRRP
jgi:hypothetical protein